MNEGIMINLLGPADWSGAMATIRTHMVFLAGSLLLGLVNIFSPHIGTRTWSLMEHNKHHSV